MRTTVFTASLLSATAFMISLAACGDTIENTTINQTGLEVYDSEKDLPKCTDDNEGEQAVIKGEATIRFCIDGKWTSMAQEKTVDFDFSCKTEELKDGSGIKVICNGDSIGVVHNGAAGSGCTISERTDSTVAVSCGKSTTVIELTIGLPNDTLEADSERIAISLDSLAGYTQKGPFLKGSTVYLYELSDGRTLKQTNGNFTSKITRDDGHYRFTARDLVSQYAMLVVDGHYRNEVTGEKSDESIRLNALTDMRKRSSANVNLLTHLEFDRVYQLVTRGDSTGKKLSVKQAKHQAQKEILDQFFIKLDDNTDAEDMDVFGKSDADAALLAVSVLLQRDSGAIHLSVQLTEISNDIVENGEWDNDSAKAAIADWAMAADNAGRLDSIAKNVTGWGLGEAPDFQKFVRNFWYTVYKIGACTKDRENKVIETSNSLSSYFKTQTRFICKDGLWKVATDQEKDSYTWTEAEDGELRNGQVTGKNYKYDSYLRKWVQATENDTTLLRIGCTINRTGQIKGIGVQDGDNMNFIEFVCKNSDWHIAQDIDHKTAGQQCIIDSVGKVYYGEEGSSSYYYCTSDGWIDMMDGWTWIIPKEDRLNPNVKYDSLTDDRDQKVYKIITIGSDENAQTWMAENLNYADSNATEVLKGNSWCSDDDSSKCEVTGRLYTWKAALEACPKGWHLPTGDDFASLITAAGGREAGGKKLKSLTSWDKDKNGTDDYGFSALPAGTRPHSGGFTIGTFAIFWSATEAGDDKACSMNLYNDDAVSLKECIYNDIIEYGYLYKNDALSVRCVKD